MSKAVSSALTTVSPMALTSFARMFAHVMPSTLQHELDDLDAASNACGM